MTLIPFNEGHERTAELMLQEIYTERISQGVMLDDTAINLLSNMAELEVHITNHKIHHYVVDGYKIDYPNDEVDALQYYGFITPAPMAVDKKRDGVKKCKVSGLGKEWLQSAQ